jgi:hypothetical protein
MSYDARLSHLPRPLYILARIAEMLGAFLSTILNVVVFSGSTHQTTSSRAYIEGQTDPKWAKRRDFIDRVFFLQPNHCAGAWSQEVHNARKTLERAQV